jgi:hypothetical protein
VQVIPKAPSPCRVAVTFASPSPSRVTGTKRERERGLSALLLERQKLNFKRESRIFISASLVPSFCLDTVKSPRVVAGPTSLCHQPRLIPPAIQDSVGLIPPLARLLIASRWAGYTKRHTRSPERGNVAVWQGKNVARRRQRGAKEDEL